MNQNIFGSVLLIVVLLIIGYSIYQHQNKTNNILVTEHITTFTECANAGYPVMESYPRQCRTASGLHFTEQISNTNFSPISQPVEPNPSVSSGKCYVGGCSSQVCSDQEGVISTCEYRQEYACYQNARCERQANGQCGWTPTSTLQACLNSNSNSNTNIIYE